MDCGLTKGELLPYALGTSSDEERARIDAHLLECTGCLRAYLRLKNQVERGAAPGARPSDEVRRRIRADVAAIVRPRGVGRVRAWLARPIPMYQGLAVAALAAAVAMMAPQAIESFVEAAAKSAPAPMAHVDMSNPVPQSDTVY
jgi:anti-sigma factor RsiW